MRKIDLHIHTIKTISDNQTFDFDMEKLKEYCEIMCLDAIAITNHNMFDLQQYREIKETINHVSVFPGIEINIGENKGHLLVIAEMGTEEDFSNKCGQVTKAIQSQTDSITVEWFKEIFPLLNNYLLIPHVEKKPKVDQDTVNTLGDQMFCGEVGSIKKFIYAKKDARALTPVLFSDCRLTQDTTELPTRQTYVDIDEISVASLKKAFTDKAKVTLSEDKGNQIFQALPDLPLSTGLTVILGERSSGKSYTLNRLNKAHDNCKYIKQFDLLESDPSKAESEFNEQLVDKQSVVTSEFFKPFAEVVNDVATISLQSDEETVADYISSLITYATEREREDMFARCALYVETEYAIGNLNGLQGLIEAVEKLLDAKEYREIIDRNLSRDILIKLRKELIEKRVEEKTIILKKNWVNETINEIRYKLQEKTAAERIGDVDFYKIQMNREKVKRFEIIANAVKKESVIFEEKVEGFTTRLQKDAYSGAAELNRKSKHKLAFSNAFQEYGRSAYDYLNALKQITELPEAEYFEYFAKVECNIFNSYGYVISGGERAEYNFLQQINDARQYDMLLIDEPESSFDNPFLLERVDHIIKEISEEMPVVIATHNNTVGASIKPDYLVYTRREIMENGVNFGLYCGFPSNKFLYSTNSEKKISSLEVTLNCLEAGEEAYEERRQDYEILRD